MSQQLTEDQISILQGFMLGDGNLELDKKNRSVNARLNINRSTKDSEYLLWGHSIFEEFCSDKAVRLSQNYLAKTDKSYPSISLTTLANPVFTLYYNMWYRPKKIVPADLKLNQLIMLIWFLDDGSFTRVDSGKLEIKLATHGFSLAENIFLKDLLYQRYHQHFTTYCDDGNYYLYGYDSPANALIEDIKDIYPYNIMSRKATWTHAYDDSLHSFDLKREKINQFLLDKEYFYTNELGRFAGFVFERKSDRSVKGKLCNRQGRLEVAISSLRNYLKQYEERGLIIDLGRSKGEFQLGIKYSITDHGKVYFSERSIINAIS